MTRTRLKHLAVINRTQLSETTDPLFAFRYIDIGSVSSAGIVTLPDDAITFADAPSRARRIAPAGAVLVSTVRTYLRAIARAPEADEPLVFSTGFAVLEATATVDPRYLYYLCRSGVVVDEVVARSTGVSYPAIDASDLGDITVNVPKMDEQRRIADFLEDQVDRLDRAIKLRGRQDELLKDVRTAALDRCMSGQPLAAQLHPTLGPVSQDTVPFKLARAVRQISVGVVVNPSTYFTDEGVPFLHGYNVRDGWLDLTEYKRMSPEDSLSLPRSRLLGGEVLVVRAGYPGRAAVVPKDLAGANCASVLVFRCGPTILPDYLATFFNAPQGRGQVKVGQYGAAQEVISAGQVAEYVIPLVSLAEQRRRLDLLEEDMKALAAAEQSAKRHRNLLEERKQALITAAVTGQFDVSTARSVA